MDNTHSARPSQESRIRSRGRQELHTRLPAGHPFKSVIKCTFIERRIYCVADESIPEDYSKTIMSGSSDEKEK